MWYNKNPSIDKLCRGLALKVIQVMSQIHIVVTHRGAPTFSRPYQICIGSWQKKTRLHFQTWNSENYGADSVKVTLPSEVKQNNEGEASVPFEKKFKSWDKVPA